MLAEKGPDLECRPDTGHGRAPPIFHPRLHESKDSLQSNIAAGSVIKLEKKKIFYFKAKIGKPISGIEETNNLEFLF